ncbi:MAG: hypothetical protein EXR77_05490 [Myxococcales bacterium]|nr:hypothetical protein [Myxococcales bacterium]
MSLGAKTGARWVCLLLATLAAQTAYAGNTSTLPAGAFILDQSWLEADTTVQWSSTRKPLTLLPGIDRYEPGGGLQGTITASPFVRYRFLVSQLFLGLTDKLTLAVGVPLVTSTTIAPNFGWKPGDYQSNLGRKYSEDDFWQWAKSMGQPKPAAFDGNHYTLADIVVGLRWRLPDSSALEAAGVQAAVAAQVAIPTGVTQDPEQLVSAGTTLWELNNYGDAELHLALDRPFKVDGVQRLSFGIDAWYSWFRERTYVTPRGTHSPLLLTYAPYVGETYRVDPGDFVAVTAMVEVAPLLGPTWATFASGYSLEKANNFPPLLNLTFGHSYISVGQSRYYSQSAVWSWDREKLWLPGDKNTVRLGADISLLRMGLPLQFYTQYRNQEWVAGRNTRASNIFVAGVRLIMKFW